MEDAKPLRPAFTWVVGVRFSNDDGQPRQEIVERCRRGDRLVLRRDPGNEHDANAIAVDTLQGQQIGYLAAKRAKQLAPQLDAGRRVDVVITEITADTQGDNYLGVNIEITRYSMKKSGMVDARLIWVAALAAGVLAATPAPSRAADYSSQVDLKIDKVYAKRVGYMAAGRPTVIFTVTNRSPYTLRIIAVSCTFLRKNNPVTTSIAGASNVPPGGSATETTFSMEGVAFDSATCRVTNAIRDRRR